MACDNGVPGVQAGARPGSRRCGVDVERSEAAWEAKNRSGAAEDCWHRGWRRLSSARPSSSSRRTKGMGHRELEEDKAHGLGSGRIRSRTAGMGSTRRRRAAFGGVARGGAPRARVAGSRCQGKAGWEKTGGTRVVWLVARRVSSQRTGCRPRRSPAHGRRHGEKKNRGGRELEMVVMAVL